jgi:hypothetical protein
MTITFRQRAWPYPETVSSLPASVLVMYSVRCDHSVTARITYTIRDPGHVAFWNQPDPYLLVRPVVLEKDIELPVEDRLAFEWKGPPRATAMSLLITVDDGVTRDTDHVEVAINGPRLSSMRWLEPPADALASRRAAALPRASTASVSLLTSRSNKRRS